jgi:hypothetical protein
MKIKPYKVLLKTFLLLTLFLSNPFLNFSQNQTQAKDIENLKFPLKTSIPGRIQGTGTYFEIKDSKYLNVSLFSGKEIEVSLESIPKMVSLILGPSKDAATTLILKGLEPNKKYYKYQDSYKNRTEILTDKDGSYTFVQDLTKPHHIWFQEKKGTIYLPEYENKYGTWDEKTRTYTLNKDLADKVEIVESNFTFDGNGHSIVGDGSGYGIYISWEKANNVIIKSLKIKNFTHGIFI